MTISTFTFFTFTGGLLLLKLAVMAFALVLLVKSLLPHSKPISIPVAARQPLLSRPRR